MWARGRIEGGWQGVMEMNRREFLQAGMAAGAGLAWASGSGGAERKGEELNVVLIGAGQRGQTLMQSAVEIPGVRFRAVCDLWPYRRRSAVSLAGSYAQEVKEYGDYREMLAKEGGVDAAIIATPDFVHAEQAIGCMKGGLHVYCEKPMAETAEGARSMVRAMRQTEKLLQIGYQRRSNPRYQHVYEKLVQEAKVTGRVTHASGQWVWPVREDLGWPKRFAIADDELKRQGYGNMQEFRNWRHYRKYTAGTFADLGVHQIDVANWFLGVTPRSVLASGGTDYYKDRQWPDNIMAIFEYETAGGVVRGVYQVLSTTSAGGGCFEQFMGVEGSIRISEEARSTKVYREAYAPDWERWVSLGYLAREQSAGATAQGAGSRPADPNAIRVLETGQLVRYDLPVVLEKQPVQYHLENFVGAIRGKGKLACPGEVAFRSEAAIWKVREAMEGGKRVMFTAEDVAV